MKNPALDIILWRHADAGEPLAGLAEDLQRPLSPKGRRQARRMAAWLDRHLPAGTRGWCSPAVRTRETAAALDRPLKPRDELGPHARVDDVLALLRCDPLHGPQMDGAVLLVGHQPWIGGVAARLLGLPGEPARVRKGAVWWLRVPLADAPPRAWLHAALTAELADAR